MNLSYRRVEMAPSITIFVIMSVLSFGQSQKFSCHVQDESVSNRTCYVLFTRSLSWEDAQKFCSINLEKGHLAEPITQKERQITKDLVSNLDENDPRMRVTIVLFSWDKQQQPYMHPSEVWIGARTKSQTDDFFWEVSHKKLATNDSRWIPKYPKSSSQQECVLTTGDEQKSLYHETCNRPYNLLCETEITNDCNNTLPNAVDSSNYCFNVYNLNLTWKNAESFCLEKNSHLAESTTASIWNTMSIYLEEYQEVWIGAIEKRANVLTWTTSREEVTGDVKNLLAGGQQEGHLVWLNAIDGVKLQVRHITEAHGFVCQTAAVDPSPRLYVAILPNVSFSPSPTGYLKVTSGFQFVVYITFQVMIKGGGEENKQIVPLAPKSEVKFDLSSLLSLYEAGIPTRFVNVYSNQPVSVTLFIMDTRDQEADSIIVFPSALSNTSGATYILFSVLSAQEDADLIKNSTNSLTTTTPGMQISLGNLSQEKMQELIEEFKQNLKRDLLLESKNLSLFRRTKECAIDRRSSSKIMGCVIAIPTITIVFLIIIFGDVITSVQLLYNLIKNKKKNATSPETCSGTSK